MVTPFDAQSELLGRELEEFVRLLQVWVLIVLF